MYRFHRKPSEKENKKINLVVGIIAFISSIVPIFLTFGTISTILSNNYSLSGNICLIIMACFWGYGVYITIRVGIESIQEAKKNKNEE